MEEELKVHGAYASVTKGVSMRPLFKTDRDMVILEAPRGELKKYDVALYRDGTGKYILHRVIAVKEDHYVIRGDNTYVREYVSKDRIIGVLTEFNRAGKHISVENRRYRLYARLWCFIYPIRSIAYRTLRTAKRCARKIIGK
ncbi:MAG: S24/S26 family peptidase [Clostridia bacterium]|nr:S24/S26 family peptidase [Clostridia bacterium]